jgi:tetratricopeptide (TPR) repeat protein
MSAMLYVLFKSKEKEEQILAVVLVVYFVGHLMELQTAFDTTISYVPLTVMAGLATILFGRVLKSSSKINNIWVMPKWSQYTLGGILIAGFSYLLLFGTIPIIKAQTNSGVIRKIGSSEKRIPLYENLFGSPLDRGTFLWKTSTDLQRGVSKNTDVLEDPKSRENFIKEIDVITKEYSEYILNNKLDYRSYVSLASLYMFESLFGIDHLDKAQAILDASIGISPKIPQAYWMKSVTYLYQQKFDLAREWANKGLEINPNIEQSQNIVKYIDDSIKTFPEIDFYFFLQI